MEGTVDKAPTLLHDQGDISDHSKMD
jgi:hypothetical protein